MFKTKSFTTATQNIESGDEMDTTTNVALSGYTPVAIQSIYTNHTGSFGLTACHINGNTVNTCWMNHNPRTWNGVYVTFTVLYRKNM